MTVYIGVDFHARQQTISYLTTEDEEIQRLQLDHGEPEEVRRFYRQFAGQRVVVGFESSGRAAWFEELLEELGCEIWIGHATAIVFAICDLTGWPVKFNHHLCFVFNVAAGVAAKGDRLFAGVGCFGQALEVRKL